MKIKVLILALAAGMAANAHADDSNWVVKFGVHNVAPKSDKTVPT